MYRKEGATSQGRLKVECSLPVHSLLHFEYEVKPNSHAYAEIKVILEDTGDSEELLYGIHKESIRVTETDADGNSFYPPVFAGLILRCGISHEGGLRKADLTAVSGSFLLDTRKKCRSFQETGMSYEELAARVLFDTPKAALLYTVEPMELEKPVFQYEETDFEFLKRIASHQNTCIYPDIAEPLPRIMYGLRKGDDHDDMPIISYKAGTDIFAHNKAKIAGGYRRFSLRHIEIKSHERLFIGDNVGFQGYLYRVCTQKAILENGLLYYIHTLAVKNWIWQNRIHNRALPGVSLSGTVLERKQEFVKLHLDIDREQDQEKAYLFPWKPETGNIMYCMPETGTRVYLYIGGPEEGEALAVSSIRGNGTICPETQNTDKRYLSNEFSKVMKLHPDSLEFQSLDQEGITAVFRMTDENGILFHTGKSITIRAKDDIQFKGKTASISASGEFLAMKKDPIAPTVLDICTNINMIGKKGKVTSSKKKAPKPVMQGTGSNTDETKQITEYNIDDIAGQVLSSIPQAGGDGGNELATVLRNSLTHNLMS